MFQLSPKRLSLLTANGESHVFDSYLGAGPENFHMTHCRHVVKVRVWFD